MQESTVIRRDSTYGWTTAHTHTHAHTTCSAYLHRTASRTCTTPHRIYAPHHTTPHHMYRMHRTVPRRTAWHQPYCTACTARRKKNMTCPASHHKGCTVPHRVYCSAPSSTSATRRPRRVTTAKSASAVPPAATGSDTTGRSPMSSKHCLGRRPGGGGTRVRWVRRGAEWGGDTRPRDREAS